jgi:hypothetical protein
MFVLIILVHLSGCDTSRQSPQSLSDSGSVMELWNTYTHCYRSGDLDAMRDDAQRLGQAANTFNFAEYSSPPEHDELAPSGPSTRLSVDPAAMAVSCTLHTAQTAQERGHLNVAREMFQLIVLHFPQARYQYYTDQALLGLEYLNGASRHLNRPTL